ncbi:MAG TPA: hypothetical protein VHE61_00660 [Opitutaceae bacterium]|nr:hypothetical protein [Opitutaceae bacterium]
MDKDEHRWAAQEVSGVGRELARADWIVGKRAAQITDQGASKLAANEIANRPRAELMRPQADGLRLCGLAFDGD